MGSLLFLGGNQRDLARQKNLKKQAEQNKGKRNDNLTVEQRKQRSVLTSTILPELSNLIRDRIYRFGQTLDNEVLIMERWN